MNNNETQNIPNKQKTNNKRSQSVSPTRNNQQEVAQRKLPDRTAKRNIGSYADNTPRLTRTPKGKLIPNPDLDRIEGQDSTKRSKNTISKDDDEPIADTFHDIEYPYTEETSTTPPALSGTLEDSIHAPDITAEFSGSSTLDNSS